MDNGIYIALSRQMALFRDMATVTNNLANANTNGFQAEKIMFAEMLKKDNNLGDHNDMSFAVDMASLRDTKEGPLRATGNPLDVAIAGDGYFMVETPMGIRYTRSGAFQLDGEGRLINSSGYPVLDSSEQPIEFPPEARDIVIGTAGNISVNGEDFGAIGVALFENQQLLRQLSGGLYSSEVEPTIGTEDNVKVTQGMLEGSNVQPVVELTRMIEVSRGVGSVSKYIEMMYDMQRKTINTWTQQS